MRVSATFYLINFIQNNYKALSDLRNEESDHDPTDKRMK
jgi:hypothetical protein